MESSVQSESETRESAYRSSQNGDRPAAIRREMEYLNTIGKRFVAAIDRFQVHRALLAALQELYSFTACSILLKGEQLELSIIPRYPLNGPFIEEMITRIARAAHVIGLTDLTAEELAVVADFDAPDEFSPSRSQALLTGTEVGDCLTIPLTVENRIIGMLSLFDERPDTFKAEQLQLTTIIADYAAVALEMVRLRERETALWQQAELERRRLELILSSMAEGLLITNANGAITSLSLNRSAQQLFAQALLDLELTQETPLHQLAQSSNASWLHDLAQIIDRALEGNTVVNQELIAGISGENVPLTLSVSAAPLYDAGEMQTRPVGVVAVLNDITSTKQIEKLKDDFISVVSHELRTPLTTIKGYTQHLIRRMERSLREKRRIQQESSTPTAEPHESYDLRSLNIVQGQADHLERLVNDLLDLSRVQWGQLDLQYARFYLADLLTECVRSAQASAEQHVISLDIQVKESEIEADRRRVSQVVGNILDNAVKYSPNGGQVIVRLQEQEGDYLVSIIDQGIGVSREYLDHIFERFYRVRNTASRPYAGIGLGLYVAKAIVEGHGGHIWLTSNEGPGTTFYFTLPRKARTG